ncbi:MAG: PEP-CTERM sorting domain-containing protein [Verrucomicrobia bacterium]|nr:PEP-CTERM sorting domain-containing protein [Verrucomicrobiota bacterium]
MLLPQQSSAQITLVAEWNFNNFGSTTTTIGFGETLAADSGTGSLVVQTAENTGTNFQRSTTNGTTLGAYDGAPAGGLIDFRRGNRWNNGYAEVRVDMSGLRDLTFSFAARYYSTFNSVTTLQYSVDGGTTFTNFGTINRDDHMGSFTLFQFQSSDPLEPNYVNFAALDNQSDVRIRLFFAADGGANSSGSGLWLDNIVVTAIPEPSTYVMIFGLLVLGVTIVARRRSSSVVRNGADH